MKRRGRPAKKPREERPDPHRLSQWLLIAAHAMLEPYRDEGLTVALFWTARSLAGIARYDADERARQNVVRICETVQRENGRIFPEGPTLGPGTGP